MRRHESVRGSPGAGRGHSTWRFRRAGRRVGWYLSDAEEEGESICLSPDGMEGMKMRTEPSVEALNEHPNWGNLGYWVLVA